MGAQSQNVIYVGPQMAKIRVDNRKGVNFLHWTIWGPPLKIKISKIGLRHVLRWLKSGLEPKFHESGTFGGFGKRRQSLSRIFNTGPYGDPPLKNQNFENRASSCFKLAQIRPRAKISLTWVFWWLRKTWTHKHTRFMFYKYRNE